MGLSMLLLRESQATAGYQVACRSLIMAVCVWMLPRSTATPSVCSKVIELVPAVARLFMPEDIWPATVHGMLLGTKSKATGPGAPAVLDLKPRSRRGKEIFCPHPGAIWHKPMCTSAIIHTTNFLICTAASAPQLPRQP